jgi:hypothetical protein
VPPRRRSQAYLEALAAEQADAERQSTIEAKIMSLRSGDKNQTEEDAERLLAASRREQVAMCDPDDVYLSREQMILRRSREVFNMHGVPDASLVRGIYRRTYNPLFGQRPSGAHKSDE